MEEGTKKFVGYHGTTDINAKNILKTKYFNFSQDDEEWLGKGIYFFQDDVKQAYYYCVKAKKYISWTIIKCNIEAKDVIDLDDLSTLEEFQKFANKIKCRYKKRSDGKPRKLINAVAINSMYEAKHFDIIKKTFEIPEGFITERTNIIPMQVQLCVRNRNCIKTIEEVQYNGCKRIF